MSLLLNAGRELGYRVEEIEGQVSKVERLIEGASRRDEEMAAGMATTESLAIVQKKLVAFEAAIESLARDLNTARHLLNG